MPNVASEDVAESRTSSAAAGLGQVQPLVRVDGEGVGAIEAREQGPGRAVAGAAGAGP